MQGRTRAQSRKASSQRCCDAPAASPAGETLAGTQAWQPEADAAPAPLWHWRSTSLAFQMLPHPLSALLPAFRVLGWGGVVPGGPLGDAAVGPSDAVSMVDPLDG